MARARLGGVDLLLEPLVLGAHPIELALQLHDLRPAAGERKAIRGGGFNGEFALWMNPAARYHQLATAHVHAIGFRCAANVRAAK